MNNQKAIVTFKTTRFLPQRDNDGNAIDEVINVKIEHNTIEWTNYLKNIKHLGFIKPSGKTEVTGATILNEKNERVQVSSDILESIKKEVQKATQTPETELTPDQKRIAELEAKIEKLLNATEGKKEDDKKEVEDPELTEARKRYMEVSGKQGDKRWTVTTINEKIKELEEAK